MFYWTNKKQTVAYLKIETNIKCLSVIQPCKVAMPSPRAGEKPTGTSESFKEWQSMQY